MASRKAKRFYKAVEVAPETNSGYSVRLDDRPIRTPQGNLLVLPTEMLADAIAVEWAEQGDEINPLSMPLMGLSCTAIDKVAPVHDQVVTQIVRYGQSDMVCYRAEAPEDLVARQADVWQPVLDWLSETKGITLAVTQGIVPVPQPEESLSTLAAHISEYEEFRLAALGELTQLTGSVALALACMENRLEETATLEASRLDEDWQIEQWGLDYEAEDRRKNLEDDFYAAVRFLKTLG